MYLVHDDYTIRNAEERDAEILAGWWNDGAVMAHAGFPRGLGTTPERIIREISTDSDDGRRRLIIEIRNIPVGEMSYTLLKSENGGVKAAEIGIKICETDYQEKGHGRVLLSMLIRELFRRGAGRIILDTNLKNTRAQHVYEKLGFVKQGVRMDSWRDQDGVLQSAVDYALTETDFVDYSGETKQ